MNRKILPRERLFQVQLNVLDDSLWYQNDLALSVARNRSNRTSKNI